MSLVAAAILKKNQQETFYECGSTQGYWKSGNPRIVIQANTSPKANDRNSAYKAYLLLVRRLSSPWKVESNSEEPVKTPSQAQHGHSHAGISRTESTYPFTATPSLFVTTQYAFPSLTPYSFAKRAIHNAGIKSIRNDERSRSDFRHEHADVEL